MAVLRKNVAAAAVAAALCLVLTNAPLSFTFASTMNTSSNSDIITKEEKMIHSASPHTSKLAKALATALLDYQKKHMNQNEEDTNNNNNNTAAAAESKAKKSPTNVTFFIIAVIIDALPDVFEAFVLVWDFAYPVIGLSTWPLQVPLDLYNHLKIPVDIGFFIWFILLIRSSESSVKYVCTTSSGDKTRQQQQQQQQQQQHIEQLWQRHDYSKLGQEVCGGSAALERSPLMKESNRKAVSGKQRKVASMMLTRVCSAFYKDINEKGTQLRKMLGLPQTNSSSSSTSTAFCGNELIQTPWSQLLENHLNN